MPTAPRQLLTHRDQLPPATRAALTARPEQNLANGVLYVSGTQNPQHVGDFVEKFARVMLLCVVAVFALVCANTLWRAVQGQPFQGEAPAIFALTTLLPLGLWLIARRYRTKMRAIDAQIASGELQFGLWVTPTHVVQRDLNSGLEAVARGNVVAVTTYHGGRPPLQMVVLELRNGYRMRIVADWLAGYAGNVNGLHALLTQKLTLPEQWAAPIAAFFDQLAAGTLAMRPGQNRWMALVELLEKTRIAHDKSMDTDLWHGIVNAVNVRLEAWPDAERLAVDIWWQRFVSDGNWEYGVNGVGADTTYFNGFVEKRYVDWRMPLARRAEFCNLPLWSGNEGAWASFCETTAFIHLTELDLGNDVGAAWLRQVIDTDRFVHLKRLMLVARNDVPPAVLEQLARWRVRCGVGN